MSQVTTVTKETSDNPSQQRVEQHKPIASQKDPLAQTEGSILQSVQSGRGFVAILESAIELKVEIGHVRMRIGDILELCPGSIIELDKAAGEPVDFVLGGHRAGKGEIVVIENNFGIRITEIVNPDERV